MKKIIHTSNAPEAIGPYSQAVVCQGLVYCSGQVGLNPKTMQFVADDVESQTKQVMENLKAVLEEAGSDFSKVIKCSIFLEEMDDFGTVNKIYGAYFDEDPPARETVAVDTLPKNARVEVSCIAYL